MGGRDDFTVSLEHDDIIRIRIAGEVHEETVKALFKELGPLLQNLRARGKKLRALVDQTEGVKVDARAREISRELLRSVEYDRVAIFGSSQETLRMMRYLLNPVASALRIKFFKDEEQARRWLRRGHSPLKRKAHRYLAFGIGCALLAAIWHFVIAPQTLYLPDDFSYSASVISRDNFYDEQTAGYSGEVVSNTKFTYQTQAVKDGVSTIKNTFDVRDTSGEKIFSAERSYGINQSTHKHVAGYGDHSRSGYLFGPPKADKQPFTYWHINYDEPAVMRFQGEEDVLGLTVYRYSADYHADQTNDLTHLPGVGRTRGVNLDINLQVWIEPNTGYLVKYEDHSTAYYYNLITGQRLNPWNKFSNTYGFTSIAEHVQKAERAKENVLSSEVNTPVFFGIIAFILLARWAILMRRTRVRLEPGYLVFPRTIAVIVGGSGALVLFGWLVDSQTLTRIHSSFSSMHILTAISFLLSAAGLWVLVRRNSKRSRLVAGLLLCSTAAIALTAFLRNAFGADLGVDALLRGLGQEPLQNLSPVTAFCFLVVAVTLLVGMKPRRLVVGVASQLFLCLAFSLALFGVIGYAFSLQGLHVSSWYREMAVHTAALLMVLIPGVFALHPDWWVSRVIRKFGKSLLLALAVLALLLTLTGMTWQQTIHATTKQANIQFQAEAKQLHAGIEDALTGYVKALQGVKGLFAASNEVDRNEWKSYIDALRLSQNYPSMLGVGFIEVFPGTQKDAHIAVVRSQVPSYDIFPDSSNPAGQISSVVFIEPFTETNQRAFGYDMLTDAIRRQAMEKARDSGEAVMSDRVVLVQDAGTERSGVLFFLPVYKKGLPLTTTEQRKTALLGYVYAPIRMVDFMRSTVGEQTSGLNIEVFGADSARDIEAGNRIFSTDDRYDLDSGYKPEFVSEDALVLANNTLLFRYTTLPTHARDVTLEALPGAVLFIGILLSFLVAAITFLQSSSRQRALRLAENMTGDLRDERNRALINQQKNEAILSSIGDGVFVIDRDGRIIMFNKAAELISGFSIDEAFGRPYKGILSFHNEQDGTLVEDFVVSALSGTRAEMAQHTMLKRKDGTLVPVADSAAPIINAQGGREGAVVVFRDTTRERQLENMKDEFLSIASHELRTPMGAVRANLAMILDGDYGPVNKELVEPLTDMKASTIRLVELVNDLLDVARIEAGRMKFSLSEFELLEVLQSTVSSLAPLGREKGVEIQLAASETVMVQADIDKVKQVLTNLIGNSLKFTDAGSVTVGLNSKDGLAEITVTDTGIGISQEDQRKLFGKFKQITTAQAGKPAGTGLGLYISREIIRKMGGDLQIKSSELGKGSIFAFTIPKAQSLNAKRTLELIEQESGLHPDQK
jgi:PAS domain S-box-containing protein